MRLGSIKQFHSRGVVGIMFATLVLGFAIGGNAQSPAPRTDQQVADDTQAKIKGESALAQQNIQVSVADGVVTLSGTVTDEASRALAANDSNSVNGVKNVVNNLTVQPPATQAENASSQLPQAPTPQPQPVVRDVTIPEGTVIPIRITETLDTKTVETNDVFHGALAADLSVDGLVVLRRGSPIVGRVVEAREAAHFKGQALLSLELTDVERGGQKIPVITDNYTREGAARGKNTAEKVGGGAGLGAIVGAIAGGGKGAAIGGLAGAAAGTGVNSVTRGEQVVIPTETLINFALQEPVTVRVPIPAAGGDQPSDSNEPKLQQH